MNVSLIHVCKLFKLNVVQPGNATARESWRSSAGASRARGVQAARPEHRERLVSVAIPTQTARLSMLPRPKNIMLSKR